MYFLDNIILYCGETVFKSNSQDVRVRCVVWTGKRKNSPFVSGDKLTNKLSYYISRTVYTVVDRFSAVCVDL